MARPDYYSVLGIDKSADETQIKAAYRSQAMRYHPDKNPGDANAIVKMKEINEAYAVLSDPEKRRTYDTYGDAGLEGYTPDDIYQGVDFSSLFREAGLRDFSNFGDTLFETFFGGRTNFRRGRRRGSDLSYELSISLEEAAFGAQKTISLPVEETCLVCHGSGAEPGSIVTCDRCNGAGQIVREIRSGYGTIRQVMTCGKCGGTGKISRQPCQNCGGQGVTQKHRQFTVMIPAGADSGFEIKIEGAGRVGEAGPGDLYVVLKVEKHPVFERHDFDVYVQQEVDMVTASLGGQVKAPGLKGPLPLDIPAGTQSSTIIRLHRQGIPHLGGFGQGDEYVVIKVLTPTNLSREEKDLLLQFKGVKDKTPVRKRKWWQWF